MIKITKLYTYIVFAYIIVLTSANASIINGGTYLALSNLSSIDTALGGGQHQYDLLWSGTTGATAISWHNSVDTTARTLSIYDIVYSNVHYFVGGYTSMSWIGSGVRNDAAPYDSFIFNLTTNVFRSDAGHANMVDGSFAQINDLALFATFGQGFDLYGGFSVLGRGQGQSNYWGTFNGTTKNPLGNIVNGANFLSWFDVMGLQTYAVSDITPTTPTIPEPTTLTLIIAAIISFFALRRKKAQSLFHSNAS